MTMLSDKDMRERMKKGWRGGLSEGTTCGQGSLRKNTRVISEWLPDVCDRFNIKTLCDAGAGDMCWTKHLAWNVDYKPFDLIPRSHSITKLDITTEQLPDCDAILCRMVLNHLDDMRVVMAMELFAKSAKYLIATQFVDGGTKRATQFTRLDLSKWLGDPLEMTKDGHEDNCRLAIWDINGYT